MPSGCSLVAVGIKLWLRKRAAGMTGCGATPCCSTQGNFSIRNMSVLAAASSVPRCRHLLMVVALCSPGDHVLTGAAVNEGRTHTFEHAVIGQPVAGPAISFRRRAELDWIRRMNRVYGVFSMRSEQHQQDTGAAASFCCRARVHGVEEVPREPAPRVVCPSLF
jgi:hypothetical protein